MMARTVSSFLEACGLINLMKISRNICRSCVFIQVRMVSSQSPQLLKFLDDSKRLAVVKTTMSDDFSFLLDAFCAFKLHN